MGNLKSAANRVDWQSNKYHTFNGKANDGGELRVQERCLILQIRRSEGATDQ